jgi:hypothetical protein
MFPPHDRFARATCLFVRRAVRGCAATHHRRLEQPLRLAIHEEDVRSIVADDDRVGHVLEH